MKSNHFIRLIATTVLFVLVNIDSTYSQLSTGKTIDYSFAVVGCVRANPADTTGVPSTANVCEVNRLFTEVMGLVPQPDFLFLTGDLVYNYTGDTIALARQLKGWLKLYTSHPISSTSIQLIAIPGNHEFENASKGKTSYAAAERTWVRIMASYILGNNGPIPGQNPEDSIQSNQRQLTYSFNHKSDHFVVFNTDPTGWDAHVPSAWVNADLQSARKNKARHLFCFGHKPAYPSSLTPEDGLAPNNASLLWSVLEANKCEAYFSAHNHLWDKIQPAPGKTWQIIAGNGGSAPEKPWTNPYFGFTLVSIFNDSSLSIKSYGHPITPSTYTLCLPNVPTKVQDSLFISSSLLSVNNIPNLNESFSVYPNPSRGSFNISLNLQAETTLLLKITGIDGKLVHAETLSPKTGNTIYSIPTGGYAKGVYILELNNGLKIAQRKIVVK